MDLILAQICHCLATQGANVNRFPIPQSVDRIISPTFQPAMQDAQERNLILKMEIGYDFSS